MIRLFAAVFALVIASCAARAECLLKPDLSKRNGYWRYRIDRQTHQHCWYLSGARPAARSERGRSADTESARSEERRSARARPAKEAVERPETRAAKDDTTTDTADNAPPTPSYLVDDAWNVIGLEPAPAASESAVERLKRISRPRSVAWTSAAPLVPVQERSLVPLVPPATASAAVQPTAGLPLTALAAIWIALTGALMWWIHPRRWSPPAFRLGPLLAFAAPLRERLEPMLAERLRPLLDRLGPLARRLEWLRQRREDEIRENQELTVASDLRLLMQAVSAHFEAENERNRRASRDTRRQRRSG